MSTVFPSSLDTFSNPSAGDPLSGGHHSQHGNANDAIAALEAKVGVDNSAVTTTLDYKVRTALPASISAAQSAAIAACPAETTATIGNLIAGASAKAVIAASDVVGVADSAASNLIKQSTLQNLLDSLYFLGIPKNIFSTAIPFVLLPGDGGSNGLTFTGSGGAFTLSAAPLAGLFSGLAGRGCYGWLPANSGGSGNSAGWYYFVPSSDTAGTFYANTYTGGQPVLVGSPTTFAGSPSGRITQTTSEVTAISGVNMTPLGNNGELELKFLTAGDTASGNKFFKMRLGATLSLNALESTTCVGEFLLGIRNAGSQTIQTLSRGGSVTVGVGSSSASISGNFIAIDLSVATTAITLTMQLSANTGCMAYLAASLTQKYRP